MEEKCPAESLNFSEKKYWEDTLKNLLILFRCAKRYILPNKAETSEKAVRSFYGQNSAAQSHKIQ